MVSIVIATYNRKFFLSHSLKSALRQTYMDIEIIIVDDGSTDDTDKLIREEFKDPRIKYFRMANNSGATAARNFGLDKMRGDYFLVWDSDDTLYPNAIREIIGVFEKNKDLAVVSAPARSLINGKEVEFTKMPEGVIPKEVVICRSLATNHKVRVAKTALCGDIRYKAKNIDFLVNVEMAERGKWYCYGRYLGDVIIESDKNSLTSQRKKANLTLSIQRAPFLAAYLDKYGDLLKAKSPHRYAGFAYGVALGFYADNEIRKSRYYVRESLGAENSIKYIMFYLLTFIPFGLRILQGVVKMKNRLFLNL